MSTDQLTLAGLWTIFHFSVKNTFLGGKGESLLSYYVHELVPTTHGCITVHEEVIGYPVLCPALLPLPISLTGGVHMLLQGVCVIDKQLNHSGPSFVEIFRQHAPSIHGSVRTHLCYVHVWKKIITGGCSLHEPNIQPNI